MGVRWESRTKQHRSLPATLKDQYRASNLSQATRLVSSHTSYLHHRYTSCIIVLCRLRRGLARGGIRRPDRGRRPTYTALTTKSTGALPSTWQYIRARDRNYTGIPAYRNGSRPSSIFGQFREHTKDWFFNSRAWSTSDTNKERGDGISLNIETSKSN